MTSGLRKTGQCEDAMRAVPIVPERVLHAPYSTLIPSCLTILAYFATSLRT